MKTLKFDRKFICDYCGDEKMVSITQYGTTCSNRLICKKCAENLNNKEKNINGKESFIIKEEINEKARNN